MTFSYYDLEIGCKIKRRLRQIVEQPQKNLQELRFFFVILQPVSNSIPTSGSGGGRWLKVLHPAALAEEIRQLHLEAAQM